MSETKNYCKYHVRSPSRFKSFRVITLSERKGIKATIGSPSKKPYSKSSKIINLLGSKAFYTCTEFLPIARRIARRPKVQ